MFRSVRRIRTANCPSSAQRKCGCHCASNPTHPLLNPSWGPQRLPSRAGCPRPQGPAPGRGLPALEDQRSVGVTAAVPPSRLRPEQERASQHASADAERARQPSFLTLMFPSRAGCPRPQGPAPGRGLPALEDQRSGGVTAAVRPIRLRPEREPASQHASADAERASQPSFLTLVLPSRAGCPRPQGRAPGARASSLRRSTEESGALIFEGWKPSPRAGPWGEGILPSKETLGSTRRVGVRIQHRLKHVERHVLILAAGGLAGLLR